MKALQWHKPANITNSLPNTYHYGGKTETHTGGWFH